MSRLDTALDELFSVPVEEFVAKRDALMSELKAAGDKEAAASVKAQHKPTQAAHALNMLPRTAKTELNGLFAAAHRLASGKDFKAALETQRAALDAVRKKIAADHAGDIVVVLRGAMVDADLANAVMRGRFSKLPEVQVGFFGAAPEGGLRANADEPHKSPVAPAPRAKAHDAAALEAIENARKEKERAEQHARDLRLAEREVGTLSATADKADEHASRLEQRASNAEELAAEARREATDANDKATEARRHVTEAVAKLKKLKALG